MRFFLTRFGLILLLGTALAAGLAGCGGGPVLDSRDERDPIYKRARAKRMAQDYDAAIELYYKALERRPGLAGAHLELGLIFDQQKGDEIRAIYHYQRYLEMNPNAEKKDLVNELIRHARITYAASLPDRPSEAIKEIVLLKKEITVLRDQLNTTQADLMAARGVAPAPAAATAPAVVASARTAVSAAPVPASAPAVATPVVAATPPAPAPAPAAPLMDSYMVQPGDTLSRIAGRMYNDSGKWEVIYNANRGVLTSPQSLKAGQTLVIPR